jgi:hypothetical protein
MTRGKLLIGVVVASFALGVAPALAQSRSASSADPDSRSSGPERSGGTAVDRSSAGPSSSGSSSSSSSSSSPSATESSSPSSGGGSPSSSAGSSRSEYVRAPVRPSDRAEREQSRSRGEGRVSSGGGSTSGSARAVPRGGSGDGDHLVSSPGRSSASASAENGGDSPSSRAVPTYSRPRDGRPSRGTAVDREYPYTPNGNYASSYYYRPYSSYYGYGRYYYTPGYGFGLGYFYDPSWYDPSYYGGFGSGYSGYGSGYPGYYGGYQGGYGSSSYGGAPSGSLRLKIKPRDAEVYVDGYFVGKVDSFDGIFQKLNIDAGGHRIEIKAPGHETIQFDVLITSGETVTYKGDLKVQ